MRYNSILTIGYLLVLTWAAYDSDAAMPDWIGFALVFVLPFILGFAAGLWPLVALPLAVLIAVPAGYGSGELPVWFGMAFLAVVALPAILLGWAVRWAVRHYARPRRGNATSGVNS